MVKFIALRFLGSITSRCSGKWARTHPPGRIKDRTRETAEIEPVPFPSLSQLKRISRCTCAGTAKKCTKKRDARAELSFCSINALLFWRSCCRRRCSLVRSLITFKGFRVSFSGKQEFYDDNRNGAEKPSLSSQSVGIQTCFKFKLGYFIFLWRWGVGIGKMPIFPDCLKWAIDINSLNLSRRFLQFSRNTPKDRSLSREFCDSGTSAEIQCITWRDRITL